MLILFALGMVSQANTLVLAQESAWTAPLELGEGWFPDIAVGHEGSVHVVWHDGITRPIEGTEEQDSRDALMYRELRDGGWTQTNDVFAANPGVIGFTVRNSIATGPDGRIHVLFRHETDLYHFSAPLDQSWSANAWGMQTQVNRGGGVYYNALAIDSTGKIHALWTQSVRDDPQRPRTCSNCANLFYRFSDDGGTIWSLPMNLSRAFEGANRPQIKIDQFDRIHVVWDEGFDWYAGEGESRTGVYIRSDDGGATWSTPKVFGLAGDTIRQTTLGLTAEGNPLVIYRSVQGRRLYYQLSQDGGATWADPAEIPGIRARGTDNNLDAYSVATDSAGNLHLLMGGFREDEGSEEETNVPSLLYLRWNGETWSAPETVMADARYPEWPRIAVANGNQLHAVWFTRAEDLSSTKGIRVQYSSKLIDAPTQAAAPIFTPTPVTTPTATPEPPSPTPFPTLVPSAAQAPPLDGGPAWERPALVTIFIALTPFLGFLIVVGGVTLRTRLRNQSRWQ